MRYFINLSYLGTNYSGWQRQTSVPSIQETIESAISKLLKEETKLIGCGRTDAGVHAFNYIAHFNSSIEISSESDFLYKINRMVPRDIRIYNIEANHDGLHAQRSAVSRTYRYYFHLRSNPFIDQQSTLIHTSGIDTKAIYAALSILLKNNDYVAFCKQANQYPSTICNLTLAKLYANKERDRFYFEFSANRFLRSMIRIIVHRLLLVGNHTLSLEAFNDYFISKPLLNSNSFAYPQGLVLYAIDYNNKSFNNPSVYPIHNNVDWIELSYS